MATGIYTRVFDTVVSGNALVSALSGNDVRALEFSAATNNNLPLALTASTQINVDQLFQAALPNGQIVSSDDLGTWSVQLGADVASQAAAYVSLFNLRSTNDVRVINFICGGITSSGKDLAAKVVNLANNAASKGTSIIVQAAGVTSTVAPLFTNGKNSGTVGFTRDVLISASSLTSGSEAVIFNVGDGFNA